MANFIFIVFSMYYTSRPVYKFISQQTNDPIVERKTCTISGNEFPIYKSDLEFYDKISPVINGKRYQIPTPTLCPEERQRRRLLFRNERKLYKRKCDATGEQIISIYSPDKPYKVYNQEIWWSDKWNPFDYGKTFDSSKTFSEQFNELLTTVPLVGLIGANNENSEYVNLTADSKNCYIVIESSNNEDCYYGYRLQKCKNDCDCAFCHECEECYETQSCHSCYHIAYGNDCQNCRNALLIKNCSGCEYCFGCINLQNKRYCIFNKQVTKEAYEQFMQGALQDFASHKKTFQELSEKNILKYAYLKQTEQTFGNYLTNTKNCIFCDDGYDAENCKYGEHVRRNAKNIMDASTAGRDAELIYESINTGISDYMDLFCAVCWSCTYLSYCFTCFNSNYCFGCVGLRNKEYCIFNKQYNKEEYEKLVPKIIEKMIADNERGEFFHPSISPFGYNETVAQEDFTLTHEEALSRGYKRQEKNYDPTIPEGIETLKGDDIPTDISTVTDDILKKIFVCEISGRPFRIIKQELALYRKHHLPLPRRHPDQRHLERMNMRAKGKLHLRNCDKCGMEMASVYSDRDAINRVSPNNATIATTPSPRIYCESCYTQEIYG